MIELSCGVDRFFSRTTAVLEYQGAGGWVGALLCLIVSVKLARLLHPLLGYFLVDQTVFVLVGLVMFFNIANLDTK